MAKKKKPAQAEYLGPYELRGELAPGGMAIVWRAYDRNLDREVAIKEPTFDPNLSRDVLDEMGRRFVEEGKAAAKLNHPGIVTIHAADVYDGRPAIVMELIDGETLSKRLERGRLQPVEALAILDELLDAVGHAHGKGIIHRDIKPDNIFITKEGRVKLADFGIAHVDDSSATRATMVGAVLGTPGYMSPEQARGKPVDERSDLFSVGVVGYEMLTGSNPFNPDGADSTKLLYRIVHEEVPDLSEEVVAGLPDDLRPAIMAALEKDPDDRPQTAKQFKEALHGVGLPKRGSAEDVDEQETEPELEPPTDEGNGRPPLPKWFPYALVAGIAVVLLGALLLNSGALSGGCSASPPVEQDGKPSSSQGFESSTGGAGADSATRAANDLQSAYYLAASEGYVAVFSNSQATPYQITNLSVSNLGSDIQSRLDSHIPFSSVEDALSQVEEWRGALQAAEEEAARQAEEEAARQAEEEAARKAAEEEAARKAAEEAERQRQAEAAKNTWYVCANDFVTLRAGTSTSAYGYTRINVREPVEYLSDAGGGWSFVRYKGTEGYVITKFISPDANAPLVYDDV